MSDQLPQPPIMLTLEMDLAHEETGENMIRMLKANHAFRALFEIREYLSECFSHRDKLDPHEVYGQCISIMAANKIDLEADYTPEMPND